MTNDSELLAAYATHLDAEAFAQLVERYQRLVWATCRRRLHVQGDVDDAVQETFLRVARSAAGRDNLGAWIYRCAMNVATDHNRRRQTRDRHESTAALPELVTDAHRELAELREHLDTALQKLNDHQRELIVQRFFTGRSQTELAAHAGVSPSAISHRLDRAVDALRKQLTKLGCVLAGAALMSAIEAEHASAAVPPELTAKLTAIGLSGVKPRPRRGPAIAATAALVGGAGLMIVGLWMALRPIAPARPALPNIASARGVGFTVAGATGGLREPVLPPRWNAGVAPVDSPLAGRILDTAGKPIANAKLEAAGSTVEFATTDGDGRYAFKPLPPGEYSVGVEVDGYLSVAWNGEAAPKVAVSADSHAVRDFILTRGVGVTVRVFDTDHEPLPNADIYVVLRTGPDATSNEIRTGRDGTALVTLPQSNAPAQIMADAEDHMQATTTVTPALVDRPQTVDLTLYDGHTVHGIALCADGKPAKGFQIYPSPTWWIHNRGLPMSFDADIDSDGHFTLNHMDEGPCTISVYRPDTNEFLSVGAINLPAADGAMIHVTVPGPSPGSLPSLTGRITFKGDGGVPGYIDVQAIGHSAAGNNRMLMVNVTRNGEHVAEDAAAGGVPFEFSDLPPDTYRLSFSTLEMDAKIIDDVKVPGPPLNVELNIGGKPHLAGTVIGANEQPVTHFALRVKQVEHLGSGQNYGQEESWTQVADDHGRFNIDLVSPGVYRAQISADGYAWAWTTDGRAASAGATAEVRARLSAGGSLHGCVIDPGGKPVPNANVTPLSTAQDIADREPGFASDAGSVITDAKGRFVLDHLAAGTETIRVKSDRFAPWVVTGLNVHEGDATDVPTIQLHAGGDAQGTVYDSKGEPLIGAAVEFQDDADYHPFAQSHAAHLVARAVTDLDGHYAVAHLPTQQLTVVIGDDPRDDVCVERRTLHPVEGRTAQLDFGGTHFITGRLLKRGGKPTSNARLTLAFGNSFGPLITRAKTDADGNFRFVGVPAGQLTLSCDSDTGFNHTRIIRDVSVTGRDQELGDIIEDLGTVVLYVSADNPSDLRDIAEVSLNRQKHHGWWDEYVCSTGQDDPANPVWRAVDVPAGALTATVATKRTWAIVATVPFVRTEGADMTTVDIHLSHISATKPTPSSPDGRTTIWLRRWTADGVLDARGPAAISAGGHPIRVDSQIEDGWSYRVPPGPCQIEFNAGTGQPSTRKVTVPSLTDPNAIEPVDVFENP